MPEIGIGNAANAFLQRFRQSMPAILATGTGPQFVGLGRVPGRRVDAVGHISDGNFVRRPMREKRFEEVPADLAMQLADAVDRAAAADGQVGHVKAFRRVVRVPASQGQQIGKGDA